MCLLLPPCHPFGAVGRVHGPQARTRTFRDLGQLMGWVWQVAKGPSGFLGMRVRSEAMRVLASRGGASSPGKTKVGVPATFRPEVAFDEPNPSFDGRALAAFSRTYRAVLPGYSTGRVSPDSASKPSRIGLAQGPCRPITSSMTLQQRSQLITNYVSLWAAVPLIKDHVGLGRLESPRITSRDTYHCP